MKEVYIKVLVSDNYKFLILQPWGSILAMREKPVLDNDGAGDFWGIQDGEIELSECGPKLADWKNEIREI